MVIDLKVKVVLLLIIGLVVTSFSEIHPGIDIVDIRPEGLKPRVGGMDFLSDGRLVLCTWGDNEKRKEEEKEGEVFILDNLDSEDPSQVTFTKFADSLFEPLGLAVVNDSIYVTEKEGVTLLLDHDNDGKADEHRLIYGGWNRVPHYHEYVFGMPYKDGHFYIGLGMPTNGNGNTYLAEVENRGVVLKINRITGEAEMICGGLREPNGLGFLGDDLYVSDNQGTWLPSNKIIRVQKGRFYGHYNKIPTIFEQQPPSPPAVYWVHGSLGKSPGQPLGMEKGPYAGQLMVAENRKFKLGRIDLDTIGNEVQGTAYTLQEGDGVLESLPNRLVFDNEGNAYVGMLNVIAGNWGHRSELRYGVQKLKWKNNQFFDWMKTRLIKDGFRLFFSEPMDLPEERDKVLENFEIEQFYYESSEDYGGKRQGVEDLEVKNYQISGDGKIMDIKVDGLKEGHVVKIRIRNESRFKSVEGEELWTTTGYYTLNQFTDGTSGARYFGQFKNSVKAPIISIGPGKWKLLTDKKTLQASIYNVSGQRVWGPKQLGQQGGEYVVLEPGHLETGLYFLDLGRNHGSPKTAFMVP